MLEKKIFNTIQQYQLIKPNDAILVAVSGGPDSVCLLNCLFHLKEQLQIKEIAVAHVNHMLREEAEEETQFVKKICENSKIRFFVKYVDIKKIAQLNKCGEEETGRKERYQFFEEIAKKNDFQKIAIAHNQNDNAETVLMHLLRGSGISGLSGIQPYRDGKYIRPLIQSSREEIEVYCQKHHLEPKYDKSNEDNHYTRNRIRNQLIPFLQENFNSNIIGSLNRLSTQVLQEEQYMKKVVEDVYETIKIKDDEQKIQIHVNAFNQLDPYLQSKIILFIVQKLFGDTKGIEKIHVEDMIKLCNRNIGNKYLTPNKSFKVFVKSGVVSFEKY